MVVSQDCKFRGIEWRTDRAPTDIWSARSVGPPSVLDQPKDRPTNPIWSVLDRPTEKKRSVRTTTKYGLEPGISDFDSLSLYRPFIVSCRKRQIKTNNLFIRGSAQ